MNKIGKVTFFAYDTALRYETDSYTDYRIEQAINKFKIKNHSV